MNPSSGPPAPGFLKSCLIHLAGADPQIMRYLPSHEASDYAKMGVTVLIPFGLALTAGSFTLYTHMDSKNPLLAFCFGVVWATAILGIDVVMMSQLVHKPALTNRGPVRAYVNTIAPVQSGGDGRRRWFVALLRVLLAGVLGIVMSHCLVLAIFKDKILQKVVKTRQEERKNIDDKQGEAAKKARQLLAVANWLEAVTSPDEFLHGYKDLQARLSNSQLIDLPKDAVSEVQLPASSSALESNMKPYEDVINRCTQESVSASTEALTFQTEIDKIKDELLLAGDARRNEEAGIPKNYGPWTSLAFRSGMPVATSKISGKGSRVADIDRAIAGAKVLLASSAEKLKNLQARADAAAKALDTAKTKYIEEKQKFLDANGATARAQNEERENAKRDAAQQRRVALAEEIKHLTEARDALESEYKVGLTGLNNEGFDVLEQTLALFDLITTRDATDRTGGKRYVILATVAAVFLSLMLIDLTPLMMKLMRGQDAYGEALVRASQGALGGEAERVSYVNFPKQGGGSPLRPPR